MKVESGQYFVILLSKPIKYSIIRLQDNQLFKVSGLKLLKLNCKWHIGPLSLTVCPLSCKEQRLGLKFRMAYVSFQFYVEQIIHILYLSDWHG